MTDKNQEQGLDLTASQINNIGVEWYRSGELTTAFQFFYHAIERFKAGRTSAAPPATTAFANVSSDVDVILLHAATSYENTNESPSSSGPQTESQSTPRTRLEGIFANTLLFQEQAYRCPFRISYSGESQHYYFSPEPTQDYILCSCIAVFNMAITVHAMDDATAAANHIQDRHQKVQGLFAHCLQLLSLVLDPMPLPSPTQQHTIPVSPAIPQAQRDFPRTVENRRKNVFLALSRSSSENDRSSSCPSLSFSPSSLNAVALATCDLLGMACLNNLIVMTVESEVPSDCVSFRNMHLETLLRTVTAIRGERYGEDSDIMAVMARLADMFLITVFFLLKFPPGPGAAAA